VQGMGSVSAVRALRRQAAAAGLNPKPKLVGPRPVVAEGPSWDKRLGVWTLPFPGKTCGGGLLSPFRLLLTQPTRIMCWQCRLFVTCVAPPKLVGPRPVVAEGPSWGKRLGVWTLPFPGKTHP
jgi:hypothetical protein